MADDTVIDRQTAAVTGISVLLILVCTVGGNLLQRLNNAYWFSSDSIFAIALGFMASVPLCGGKGLGLDVSFETVFFLYLIPPILFESGYALNHKDFFRNFTAIILFSVVGTIISTLVMGISLFHLAANGYMHGLDGSSPKEALLFGSLMSATDPVATLAVLGSLGVDPQLYALVFGESVLNDAVAIVLYQTFNALPEGPDIEISPGEAAKAVGRFLGVGVGSLVVGIAFGLVTSLITKHLMYRPHAHSEVTVIMSMAYLSFIGADSMGLSGLMAVFFAGIVSSHYAKYNLSLDGQHTTHNVARTLAFISETLVFIYFGYLIVPIFFPSCTPDTNASVGTPYTVDWGFVGWSLLMCFVSRAFNVFPLTLLVNLSKRSHRATQTRISLRSMLMMWFSGLRGAIAFALSLTVSRENREFIVPCVVVIILFTNIILGQATAPLLRLLRIPTAASAAAAAAMASVIAGDNDTDAEADGSPMPGQAVGGEADGYIKGRMHVLWTRVDNGYLKPVFGGRIDPAAAARAQAGGEDKGDGGGGSRGSVDSVADDGEEGDRRPLVTGWRRALLPPWRSPARTAPRPSELRPLTVAVNPESPSAPRHRPPPLFGGGVSAASSDGLLDAGADFGGQDPTWAGGGAGAGAGAGDGADVGSPLCRTRSPHLSSRAMTELGRGV